MTIDKARRQRKLALQASHELVPVCSLRHGFAPSRHALGFVFLLSVISGCTDVDVYTATGQEPFAPDRVALTGRVCTEDTTGSSFPVKILMMLDRTQQMAIADPDGFRFCGSGANCVHGSLNGLVDRHRNRPNSYLGFSGISSVSEAVVPTLVCDPPCDPQAYYPSSDVDAGLVEGHLSLPEGTSRDVVNAISHAESFITADMTRASPGEILRARYLVYMFFAGPPTGSPPPSPEQLAEQVRRLKDLVYERGALEFRLHIGFLYFGPKTILPAPEPDEQPGPEHGHGCFLAEGDACGCANCGEGSVNYCAACCRLQDPPPDDASSWEDWLERARAAYSAMAFAGDGAFREIACPPTVDLRLDTATTSVLLKRKDIVAYNINMRLGPDGQMLDSDGDGLSDVDELASTPATDPSNWDSDGDGLSDLLEFRAVPSQDPTDPSDRPRACEDVAADTDQDLLVDCDEGLLRTSRTIPDTDGDGLPDALEFLSGTVPRSADDRLLDFDGDGVSNAQEVLEHTNPRSNDTLLRGGEGYRNSIVDLGVREVATMEDLPALRAVTFRSAGPNVIGGAATVSWNATDQTLSWIDARNVEQTSGCQPVPQHIDETGEYTLYAECSNGTQVWVTVFVVEPWLPDEDVTVFPLIHVGKRHCYDLKVSNIKLGQTLEASDVSRMGTAHEAGLNRIIVFFTQSPEDRLNSPGITKMAVVPVTFRCTDPDHVDTCARTPGSQYIQLTDADFSASLP